MENKIQKLPPFIKFCCTVGMIPTSYKVSMTYEEQLLWLCDFLENTVIPTVNNNGQAVEELQALYVQLREYVDNYFDNLDVQTEINNKLDEMAESGELAAIIAQYLDTQGVFAFDLIADLKAAENLSSGATCLVLGATSLTDKKTNYYKVRALRIDDVIDDDLIVSLTNYPSLVAEKIPYTTKTNYVDELPSTKTENTVYHLQQFESEITSIPESQYEYVQNDYLELEEMGSDYMKVGTWNIYVGNSPYNKNLTVMGNFDQIRKICDKIGSNVLGLNECTDGKLFKPENLYLTNFYKYFTMYATWLNMVPSVDFGNGILSNAESNSTTGNRYTNYHDSQHQGYTKNVYTVKENKTLSFYSTHLSLDQATRINQIAELYTIVSADTSDYIVVAGDFNYDTAQNNVYLASFISDGFKCANNGNYKTYDDSRDIGIDEIMVSSNIDIVETHTIQDINGISDHFPIYSKIKLN